MGWNKNEVLGCQASQLWPLRGLLLLLAILASGPLAQSLPPEFQAHISAPEHWQQLLGCQIHWLTVPDLFPSSTSLLPLSSQQRRRDFFLSLLLQLLLFGCLSALLLRFLGRLRRLFWAREASRSVSRGYERLEGDTLQLSQHLALHGWAAALATALLCTGRVQKTGAVWEVYVVPRLRLSECWREIISHQDTYIIYDII